MNESSLDLGRTGYSPEKNGCTPLAPGDRFAFACAGCGDCCRGRKDILLSGLDLWRICARLRLPPAVVLRGYCDHYTGAESGLPVVRLRPRTDDRRDCPFLYKGRCSIHEAAPLACALYPLAQQIDTDTGAVAYYAQPTGCGGTPVQAVCADYLERYGVPARQPADVAWAVGCTRLSARVTALQPLLPPAQWRTLQLKLYRALYRDLDWQTPYLPQLEQALADLERYLDRVGERWPAERC